MDIINSLNIVDWVVVVIFAISIIYGFMRGLFKEMGAVVTWVAAFFIAYMFYDEFSAFLAQYIDNELIRQIISVVILILAVIFIGGLLNMFLSYIIGLAGLGSIDKLLGAVFGYLRAGLIVGIIAHATVILNLSNNDYLANSMLMTKLQPYGEMAYDVLPENLRARIENETESVIGEDSGTDAISTPAGDSLNNTVSRTVSNVAEEIQAGVDSAIEATQESAQEALDAAQEEANDSVSTEVTTAQ